MRIAVLPDTNAPDSFAEGWTAKLKSLGITVVRVDDSDPGFWEVLHTVDGFMWRHRHVSADRVKTMRILGTLEYGLKLPLYPNLRASWHYDDKIAQYFLLKANRFPVAESWVFWKKKDALTWAASTSYPKVYKLSSGAGSSNVIRIETSSEASAVISKAFDDGVFARSLKGMINRRGTNMIRRAKAALKRFRKSFSYVFNGVYPPLPMEYWLPEKNVAYFQQFLQGNEYDTRITVIGDRAFGFRRFNREGDFRASGGGILDYTPSRIDPSFLKIAFDISEKLSFQSMAYDFLYDEGRPVVIEMSYTFSTGVSRCPGHWDRELNWHEGKMKPEDAQVEDFVASIRRGS